MPSWSDLTEEQFSELLRLSRMYKREASRAGEAKAYLAGCVMNGAALEAMLLVIVHLYGSELDPGAVPKKKGEAKQLLDWSFAGKELGQWQRNNQRYKT